MSGAILLTGFGPFPGAPVNPTGILVRAVARRRSGSGGGPVVTHVFQTCYQAVDREFPALIARVRPRTLVMFGLARSAKQIRIERQARNALSLAVADAGGHLPAAAVIAPGAPSAVALRAPVRRLLAAARAAGMRAALSSDAGSYLCNYLCWRATEEAARPDGPSIIAFVHVPQVTRRRTKRRPPSRRPPKARAPRTLDDLIAAGAAIVKAAGAAAQIRR
jgi:pyroglutamyl-peptidase